MKKVTTHITGLIALAVSQLAWAQQATDPLKDAAQRAISTNPEVTAKFNAFRASIDEVDVARGGYYPRVDLSAEAARSRNRITSNNPQNQTINSTGVALSATQLLWDGFATRSQVERLDHARMTRYFEFLDASEQTAFETVRAYVDVARSRQLVSLAEENYVQHKQLHELLKSRSSAGVTKGVDLEQATARLSLAESNLATETANLHDVTERYRRIVGTAPPASLPMPTNLDSGLPASVPALLDTAVKRNVGIAAAIENLRASQAQAKERDSAFQPKVEARLRSGVGNNLDGVVNQKRDTTASLVMNWNLYNGGSDTARVRQSTSQLNMASDARDKACRDTRQTATVAYNDIQKLTEQLVYLRQNVASSERALFAYRQQFDNGIEKRSLLDVLNAENELYGAKRLATGAEYDLLVAKARTQSSVSSLVATLGLSRAGAADSTPDLNGWSAGEDSAARCPLTPTELAVTPKTELDRKALAGVQQTSNLTTPAPAPLAPLAPQVGLTTSKAAAAAKPEPVPAAKPDAPLSVPVSQRLLDWSQAWEKKDVTSYLSFYDRSFKPAKTSRAKWFANRTKLVKKDGPVSVKISNVQRRTLSPTMVETTFDQAYTSKTFKDNSKKALVWKRTGTEWYIVKESSR